MRRVLSIAAWLLAPTVFWLGLWVLSDAGANASVASWTAPVWGGLVLWFVLRLPKL